MKNVIEVNLGWMKYVLFFIIIVIVFAFLNPIRIIGAGERGVVMNFGQVQKNILGEGLHFITPIYQSVVTVNVKTQKYQTDATSASKDLQDTMTQVAVNFHLLPEGVNDLYQTVGINYGDTLISPTVQEVVKASTAQFNAEELITKRQSVKDKIEEGLKERLNPRGMIVEAVSITDFKFSQEFTHAIESKVTAQQLALKAENDLKRIEIEAQQMIAQSQGQAESIRIINEQLLKSPQYNQYMAIQKWDGVLPLSTGGALPFINIPTNGSG